MNFGLYLTVCEPKRFAINGIKIPIRNTPTQNTMPHVPVKALCKANCLSAPPKCKPTKKATNKPNSVTIIGTSNLWIKCTSLLSPDNFPAIKIIKKVAAIPDEVPDAKNNAGNTGLFNIG